MAGDRTIEEATFDLSEAGARRLDEQDPLRAERDLFESPIGLKDAAGRQCVYLCGNSLGLMPKAVRPALEQEMADWSDLGVDAHFDGANPWFSYHEIFRPLAARLVGALAHEVVMMNSLTVNLHLMMASFYRPDATRFRIVIERGAFPSDCHAVASQAHFHGFDPDDAVIALAPREGESLLRVEDVERALREQGDSIALVLLGAVNYVTGQLFDLEEIGRIAHDIGAVYGLDLAHAAGNVPLRLHDWNVDFATWCSYKYLNSGPGAVAGCFVHERHHESDLPRFEGWWGNNPASRFRMAPQFEAGPGADAWQLSNPPIMAMAPLKASMEIFDRVGMEALRAKSVRLTGYLEALIDSIDDDRLQIITPRDPARRGAQLSIVVQGEGRPFRDRLQQHGVVGDFREPNIIRLALAPLYNSFHDAWIAAERLKEALAG